MNHFRLQAVDSRLATPTELEAAGITEGQIPKDALGNMWGLAAHQVATVKALRFGNAPIVINRAMTGDGKTLAGRFQLFTAGLSLRDWQTPECEAGATQPVNNR